ncbi:MAG: hypothetical protein IT338_06475 [Thermomicrobiales bacterium]|nr:hypothetical protein [Thermomicrobiales bacterium]
MTECQGCGAWNDTSRTLCVLCGTPLAETDEWEPAAELPPLPPLPDGGLAATMPAWLREAPLPPPEPPPPPRQAPTVAVDVAAAAPSSGLPLASPGDGSDPRTFLTDDDFPRWLRDLAAREASRAGEPRRGARGVKRHDGAAWPDWRPGLTPPLPTAIAHNSAVTRPANLRGPSPTPEPAVIAAPAPPLVAAPAPLREERRPREVWQTLLLLLLVIGLVAAALWALASYGPFGARL